MKPLSFLESITFVRVRIIFEALEPLFLPKKKGSTFRGCLGWALYDLVCPYDKWNCEICKERYICPYSVLYKSFTKSEHRHHKKFPKCPPPYIIDSISGEQLKFNIGETFGFEFTLIGTSIKYLSYVIKSFERMGEIGIGQNRSKFRPKFIQTLKSNSEYENLAYYNEPEVLSLSNLKIPSVKNKLVIETEVRMRFMEDGVPKSDPPTFEFFMQRLILRYCLLAHFHCNEPWIDYDKIEIPSNIDIDNCHLQPDFGKRITQTMNRLMKLDGLIGQITYSGEGLNEWMPLIVMGSWLRIGSTATFGLGKYSILNE